MPALIAELEPEAHAYEEIQRLSLLAELGVLDTDPEPGFEALTHAAASLTQCPIALISLVDGDRQWFKARLGLNERQTPRDWSFCNHAIRTPELMEVPDATADLRFANNPLVLGSPHVRFYAGQPLDVEGVRIGTLCVIDTKPRQLDVAQRESLQDLAAAASAMLAERKKRIVTAEQQRRLTEFAMVAGDWLWETDERHCIVWVSCAYGKHPPLPEPWRLGQQMDDGPVLESPDFPSNVHTTLHQLFDAKGGFARALVRCEVRGVLRYMSHSAVCRRDTNGRWTGYRGITRDVTASVAAETAHLAASRLLANLSAQVPGVIFQLLRGVNGRLVFPYVSDRVLHILELPAPAVLHNARVVMKRLHRQDRAALLRALRRSAETMEVWHDSFRVELPHAGQRVLQVHAEPSRTDGGGVIWHGLLTDITEQLRDAAQLQRLTALDMAATRTAELRNEFLSRVSHELRTPLNAILGFSQIIRLQGPAQAMTSLLASVHHIEHAGTHLLALVNDMLELASLDHGQNALHLQPLLLAPLAEQTIALLLPLAQHRGMTLSVTQPGPVSTTSGDARAIKQVLFNLLGNAIKFAHADTAVEVHLRQEKGGAEVAMDIIDRGPGIDAAALPGLFVPFAVGSTRTSRASGTGLGLAISQKLALSMGGRITVSSVVGQGSRFTLHLPVDGRSAALLADVVRFADAVATPSAAPPRVATVLYIEDKPLNALLMESVFESTALLHLRLLVAVSGRSGIEQARALQPELILLDMQLPDIDGFGVLAALRQEPRTAHIPVFALSGDAMPEQVRKALAAGCQDYWTKPINLQSVVAELAGRFPAQPASATPTAA